MGKRCPGCDCWADTETMDFTSLIKWANHFKVPHDEIHWPDPDREDELRVAVAEAMERLGR
jgi:hypothetical protein